MNYVRRITIREKVLNKIINILDNWSSNIAEREWQKLQNQR